MKKAILLLLLCGITLPFLAQDKIIFPTPEQAAKMHHDMIMPFNLIRENHKLLPNFTSSLNRDYMQFGTDKNQKLDSIVEFGLNIQGLPEPLYASKFAYNEEHQLISVEYSSSYSGAMSPFSRIEFYYNEEGLCTSYYEKNWHARTNSWHQSLRYLILYNDEGKIIKEKNESWNSETASWEDSALQTYAYTEDGLIIQYVSLHVDYNSLQLEEKFRTIYHYNVERELIREESYIKEEGAPEWSPYSKIEYVYNEDGHEIQRMLYKRKTGEPELFFRVFSIYDHDNLLFVKGHEFDGTAWVPNYDYLFKYDENDRPIIFERKYWDPFSHQWQYRYKATRTYNQYDDVIRESSFYWDYSIGWLEEGQSNISYDEGTDITDIVLPQVPVIAEDGFNTHKKILSIHNLYYDFTNNVWQLIDYTSAYYSVLTANEDIRNSADIIRPNPAKDFIQVDLATLHLNPVIEIFTVQGQHLLASQIQEGQNISVQQLSDGMHVYRIKNGNAFYTGKLVVQH